MSDCATRAHRQTTAQSRNDASSARKRDTCICQYRWKPLCRSHFRNSASCNVHIFAHLVTRGCRPKARRADSESQFLAMKKFSRSPASRLIGARQNGFFARIAAADSQARFWVETMNCVCDRRARARLRAFARRRVDDAGVMSRAVQMPSLDFSRSLTTCGLALPPDDFIT
jgi:hypothetical protein